MRSFALALTIAAMPSLALADYDTAYKALRVFGKKVGDKQLNQVVEVRGRSGAPQPQVWKITATDISARGGTIEAEVQRGAIISQRAPTARGGTGAPFDLNMLNLDSDGAFTIANQEMEKRNTPFDRVDYVLRSPGVGRAPVWHLELFDGPNGRIATFEIGADSGTVIEQNVGKARSNAPSDYSSDRDYVSNGNREPQGGGPGDPSDPRWSRPGEKFRGVGDFFHRLGKRMERRGSELKNFFSGD